MTPKDELRATRLIGMPVSPELAAIIAKVERSELEPTFAGRVRDMVAPVTSALFVLIRKVSSDEVVAALEAYGGTIPRVRDRRGNSR
jgi:uncharacterized membrane protein